MLFAIVGLSLLSWASVAAFDQVLLQSRSAARADATHTLQENLEFIERMMASADGCSYTVLNSIDPSRSVPSSEPDDDSSTVDLDEYNVRLRTSQDAELAPGSWIGTHRIEEIRLVLHQVLGPRPSGMPSWERRTAMIRMRTRANVEHTESATPLITEIPLSVVVAPFYPNPHARRFVSCQSVHSNQQVRGVQCPDGTLFNGYNADRTLRCEREELGLALSGSCPEGHYIRSLNGSTPECVRIPDVSPAPYPTPSNGHCFQNINTHDLHAIVVRNSGTPNAPFIPEQTYFQIGFARSPQECNADGTEIVAISNMTVRLQNTDGFFWGCYARRCPVPQIDGSCILPSDWGNLLAANPTIQQRLVGRIGGDSSTTNLPDNENPFILRPVTIDVFSSHETVPRQVVLGWGGGSPYSRIYLYRMAAGSYLSCN